MYRELGTTAHLPVRHLGPAERMPFPDRHFAFVYSNAVFEHVRNADAHDHIPAADVGDPARFAAPFDRFAIEELAAVNFVIVARSPQRPAASSAR